MSKINFDQFLRDFRSPKKPAEESISATNIYPEKLKREIPFTPFPNQKLDIIKNNTHPLFQNQKPLPFSELNIQSKLEKHQADEDEDKVRLGFRTFVLGMQLSTRLSPGRIAQIIISEATNMLLKNKNTKK